MVVDGVVPGGLQLELLLRPAGRPGGVGPYDLLPVVPQEQEDQDPGDEEDDDGHPGSDQDVEGGLGYFLLTFPFVFRDVTAAVLALAEAELDSADVIFVCDFRSAGFAVGLGFCGYVDFLPVYYYQLGGGWSFCGCGRSGSG